MNAEPLKLFHDQFLETVEEQKKYHGAYQKLAQAIDISLAMFLHLVKAVELKIHADGKDTHTVPQMLMYEFADSIDGASIATFAGAARNCSAPLRTALEIGLGLAYILEDAATYEKRALSYEFYHLLAKLKTAQKCDPTSDLGIKIRGELKGDSVAPNIYDINDPAIDVNAEIAKWEKKLASPRWASVKTEYDVKKPKNWYSLWEGPDHLRKLAIHLKMLSIYEALYKPFSVTIHGAGALERVGKRREDGLADIDCLRSPKGLPGMVIHATNLTNSLSVTLLKKMVPEQWPHYQKWYAEEMKPARVFITNVTIK